MNDDEDPLSFGFLCGRCTEVHYGLPSFGSPRPDGLSADEAARAELSPDQCVLDDARFFVCGMLELPIHGRSETFAWRVWVELAEEDFARISELWEQEGREDEPPHPARLATALPFYTPTTLGLSARLQERPVGERPLVLLEPAAHPLVEEQQKGVAPARVRALCESLFEIVPDRPEVVRAVRAAAVERFGPPDETWEFDASRANPANPPPLPRTEVLVWRADPSDEEDVTTLATFGMSRRAMPGGTLRAEIHMTIRASLSREDEAATARFLAHLACYPFDHRSALDWWHLLSSPGPIPGFPSCSAVLFHPRFVDAGWDCVHEGDQVVHLLNVVPITPDERALLKRGGLNALQDRWAEGEVDLFRDRRAR